MRGEIEGGGGGGGGGKGERGGGGGGGGKGGRGGERERGGGEDGGRGRGEGRGGEAWEPAHTTRRDSVSAVSASLSLGLSLLRTSFPLVSGFLINEFCKCC